MKKADIVTSLVLIPVDALMLLLAGLASYALRYHALITNIRPVFFEYPLGEYLPALALIVCLAIVIFALNGSYAIRSRIRYPELISKVFQGISTTILILIVLIFLRRELFSSRFIIIFAWATACLFVIVGRLIVVKIKQLMFTRGYALHALAVLDDTKANSSIVAYLSQHPQLGYKISLVSNEDSHEFRENVRTQTRSSRIDEILDVRAQVSPHDRKNLIDFCHEYTIAYRYAPSPQQTSLTNYEVEDIAGNPIIHIMKTPLNGWGRVVKRALDIALSAIGIIVLFPIGIVIALAILIDSDGPAIEALPRIGRGGKRFNLYKFRSMIKNARAYKSDLMSLNERSDGPLFKLKNDPRVTRLGKPLRRLSIDELPQLWNVLRGDMSLVGPRPHEPEEVGAYDAEFKALVAIKPGITGLAQVSGRSNLLFKDEALLDLYYIEHWSLWLDIQVLVKTLTVLFKSSQSA